MRTAKELEKSFRQDFENLLKKYNAEIEITDDGKSYGRQSGIVIITISNLDDEFCEFRL